MSPQKRYEQASAQTATGRATRTVQWNLDIVDPQGLDGGTVAAGISI
jgi:hypothetical protein